MGLELETVQQIPVLERKRKTIIEIVGVQRHNFILIHIDLLHMLIIRFT